MNRMRRLLGGFLLMAMGAGISSQAVAELKVTVIADPKQALHRTIVDAMLNRLSAMQAESVNVIQTRTAPGPDDNGGSETGPALVVAIGTQNTISALTLKSGAPLLSVAIPRLNYDELASQYAADPAADQPLRFGALLLDQPLARRFDLVQAVVPNAKTVSIALGPANEHLIDEIKSEADKRGLRLRTDLVTQESELIETLDLILEQSDAMLGLLDPLVFNRATSRNVLLTAYRWRVPLIGISPAYVRAGALAAVHSTPEQIGRQLAEMLVSFERSGGAELPAYKYPDYFDVAINYQVAASMGLHIDDEDTIKALLLQQQE